MSTENKDSLVGSRTDSDCKTDRVNKKTLQVRVIYFLYLAGTSSLRPYFPIYFRHVGLDETETGMITGMQPFVRFFSEPLWGGIADKFACHKFVLMTLVVLSTLFNASLCSVSLIQNYVGENAPTRNGSGLRVSVHGFTNVASSCYRVKISCNKEGDRGKETLDLRFSDKEIKDVVTCCCNPRCLASIRQHADTGQFEVPDLEKTTAIPLLCKETTKAVHPTETKQLKRVLRGNRSMKVTEKTKPVKDTSVTLRNCLCDVLFCGRQYSEEREPSRLVSDPSAGTKNSSAGTLIHVMGPLSETDSFYILLCLSCLGQFFSGPILSIIDSSTMKILRNENQAKFGLQRLWGAIGFGLAGFLSGLAMDETKTLFAGANAAEASSYMAAFFMYFGFEVLLILACSCFEVSQTDKAHFLFRHLRILLSRPSIITFLSVVLVMGISSGVINAFLFWYLEDLGASQLVVGLSIGVTCLSEVAVFSVAGKLIKCLGYAGVLYLCLVAFMARLVAYTFIVDPWYVLPVESLHGFTYAATWSVCVSYASLISPPEIATTIQGVVSGVHFGLGWGIGGMGGGIVYKVYGAKLLFEACAVLCGVAMLLFTAVQATAGRQDNTVLLEKGRTSQEPRETDPLLG